MTRGIGPRLRRIEGAIGWQVTTLRQRSGAEVTVKTTTLLDAWLRVMLAKEPPNLHPRLSRFLATAVMSARDGEFLIGLRDECRAIWFPQPTPDEQLAHADPDPPAPIPSSRKKA